MTRFWFGVALLAVSWVMGTGCLFPVHVLTWLTVVLLGALLLADGRWRLPGQPELGVSLPLLTLAALIAPWQVRTAAVLMLVGVVAELLGVVTGWVRAGARGSFVAGCVMLAQWPAMVMYGHETARSHDLPPPLPSLLARLLELLGSEAAADGPMIAVHAARQPLQIAATWELAFDPATFCFFVGGLALLALRGYATLPAGTRTVGWVRGARWLTLAVALWLPIRLGLMSSLLLSRAVVATWEWPLNVMDQMLSPWVLLVMLIGAALMARRLVPIWLSRPAASAQTPGADLSCPKPPPRPAWAYPAGLGLAALAAVLATVALRWVPVGEAKPGRVVFVERHSTWESTERDYDTEWYGEPSGYNYAAVYRYLDQYYDMGRLLEDDAIDDQTLADCDVLIIKNPTVRYAREEIDAVERFVRRGGGLLLVGEHTNVFRCGAYVNDIARRFRFTFRHDLLFGMDDPYIQRYSPPWVPHPAVAHARPMIFAVSASVDPGYGIGRSVIQEWGLWSLPPEYNVDNYFPVPQYRTDMRYGAFIECWSTTAGAGRVLAFGDSTVWSNFMTFEPGKTELLLGLVNWLNHRSALDPTWAAVTMRVGLLILAVAAGLASSWLLYLRCDAWLTVIVAGAAAWAVASLAVGQINRAALPLPPLQPGDELKQVIIDRELSEVVMRRNGFLQDDGSGYGMIEQWLPRIGCHARREQGRDVFSGDALVVICPTRSVPPWYRRKLEQFVNDGGDLLVIDSPMNFGSTANSLLWPFGLSIIHGQAWRGPLMMDNAWPGLTIERALEVTGGEPIARLGQKPIGAMVQHGEGRVVAVGFGPALTDKSMGLDWVVEPDETLRTRFEVLFQLGRLLLDGEPIRRPASQ